MHFYINDNLIIGTYVINFETGIKHGLYISQSHICCIDILIPVFYHVFFYKLYLHEQPFFIAVLLLYIDGKCLSVNCSGLLASLLVSGFQIYYSLQIFI